MPFAFAICPVFDSASELEKAPTFSPLYRQVWIFLLYSMKIVLVHVLYYYLVSISYDLLAGINYCQIISMHMWDSIYKVKKQEIPEIGIISIGYHD